VAAIGLSDSTVGLARRLLEVLPKSGIGQVTRSSAIRRVDVSMGGMGALAKRLIAELEAFKMRWLDAMQARKPAMGSIGALPDRRRLLKLMAWSLAQDSAELGAAPLSLADAL